MFPVALALLLILVLSPMASATQGNQGYVSYNVTLTSGTRTTSVIVNESVTPATQGLSLVSISLSGYNTSLSYSRDVNSSSLLFPYMLPVIGNQSLSYGTNGYSLRFSVNRTGYSQGTFNGTSYQLTEYSFVASLASSNGTVSASGQIYALPSSLVYSVDAAFNSTASVSIKLLSTNLAIDPPASDPGYSNVVVASVVVAAVAATVIFYAVKRARSTPATPGAKPSYWVD